MRFRTMLVRVGVVSIIACVCVPATEILSQAPSTGEGLVIRGGTIVDVVRGELVPDTAIVIQGERITEIGPAARVADPPGSQVVQASGKFVMPGLWDTHSHTRDFDAGLNINHGVTSTMDMGNILDWIMAVAEAREKGGAYGPRIFPHGMAIAGRLGPHEWLPKTVEQARWAARKNIEGGATFLKVYQEATPEMIAAVADEAHKAGLNLHGHIRASDAREAILAGIDALAHGSGIAAATSSPEDALKVKNREIRFLGYSDTDANYLQDVSKFDELIKLMIDHGVRLEPNFVAMFKGVYPQTAKFEAEDHMLVVENDTRAPDSFVKAWATAYSFTPGEGVMEKLKIGLANHQLFARKFVAAGGKIFVGTDAWHIVAPGLAVWHEMELLAAAGIPPLAILQGATINPAEFVHQDENLGTVEQGKLADLLILGSNPLQDVMNVRSLETVIQHGRVQKRGYFHTPEYQNPIPRPYFVTSGVLPRPYLSSITPIAIPRGSDRTVITIKGRDFHPENRVLWDDQELEVVETSPTEVHAAVPAQLLVRPGTHRVQMMTEGREPVLPSLNFVDVLVTFGRAFDERWNGQTMTDEF